MAEIEKLRTVTILIQELNRVPLKIRQERSRLMLSGLQITVGHGTLANQNLLVSNEIPHVLVHYVQRIFFIVNHLTVKRNNNLT